MARLSNALCQQTHVTRAAVLIYYDIGATPAPNRKQREKEKHATEAKKKTQRTSESANCMKWHNHKSLSP